ncbi:MAG: twin-arginine translocase TatA/TatE family subunit [Alphaproteobacteria bacterium]|nr:twin-arginine translocase TatA/TatE family subunit [Alphaproteobacteria bacterium]
MIGPLELLIILLIVVVLFNSRKLPDVMADIGKSVSRFKQGLKGKDDPDSPDRKG